MMATDIPELDKRGLRNFGLTTGAIVGVLFNDRDGESSLVAAGAGCRTDGLSSVDCMVPS